MGVVPSDAAGSRPACWQWLLQLYHNGCPIFLLPIEASVSHITALAVK